MREGFSKTHLSTLTIPLQRQVIRDEECGRPGRRASCLFVAGVHFRHANIDYRPSHISPFFSLSSSDPFPSPAAGLFFLPYYFRQCFTDDDTDDEDDSKDENSWLKLHFRNATTTASFMRKISFHSENGI